MKQAINAVNNVNQCISGAMNSSGNTLIVHGKSACELAAIHYGCAASPFGQMSIAWAPDTSASSEQILQLVFETVVFETDSGNTIRSGKPDTARRDDLGAARLAGQLFQTGETVPHALQVKGTAFQGEVWQALLEIPFGTVVTYSDIARAIGRPKAVRAVASAIGANPIAWLIPCHRVVRSDGGLGGYRWGLARKQAMLDWEADRT